MKAKNWVGILGLMGMISPVAVLADEPKPKPANNPRSGVTDNDYPNYPVRLSDDGTLKFELQVDEAGIPTGCTIFGNNVPQTMEALLCKMLMRRARFEPALDEDDKTIKRVYRNKATFNTLSTPEITAVAGKGRVSRAFPKPIINPETWVTSEDSTSDATVTGYGQNVGLRIDVGPDGSPVKCTITEKSGNKDVDDLACANVMERARFIPARDASGKPISSIYQNTVQIRIPDTRNPYRPSRDEFPPGAIKFEVTVEKDGYVTECKNVVREGRFAGVFLSGSADRICNGLDNIRNYPALDDQGNPVRSKRTILFSVEEEIIP